VQQQLIRLLINSDVLIDPEFDINDETKAAIKDTENGQDDFEQR
jgi:hypothetical protein